MRLFADDDNVIPLRCILLDDFLAGIISDCQTIQRADAAYIKEMATMPNPTITIFCLGEFS